MFLDKYRYAHFTAAGTTTLATGPGVIHTVVINNPGTTSTFTLFDNTAGSGTIIAQSGTVAAGITYIYDAGFGTGLTITVAGTTPDITVTYLIG